MDIFLTVFWYGASGFVSLIFFALGAGILRWTVREITGKNAREQERKELLQQYRKELESDSGGERDSIEKTPDLSEWGQY